MTENAHSTFGASSMSRWANCPASIAACKNIPETSSPYAEEGTLAHNFAERLLREEEDTETVLTELAKALPDGYASVVTYVAGIKSMLCAENVRLIGIEQKVELPCVSAEAFGTADCIIEQENDLHVIDYKHGAGVPVAAEGNLQGLYYLAGAAMAQERYYDNYIFTVVQPRVSVGEPIKSVSYKLSDILDFLAYAKQKIEDTQVENPVYKTGDWCRFCRAAPFCPQKHKEVAEFLDEPLPSVFGYDMEALKERYEKIPSIRQYIGAVESFVMSEAQNGAVLPGYYVREKTGNRAWKRGLDVAASLAKFVDEEDVYEPKKVKSPAQIEKLLPREDREILESLTERKVTGIKLVKDGGSVGFEDEDE